MLITQENQLIFAVKRQLFFLLEPLKNAEFIRPNLKQQIPVYELGPRANSISQFSL